MKCRRCGKPASAESKYCEYCGIALASEGPPPQTDPKYKGFWNFLMWWKVNEARIEYQANNYYGLRFGSYRAISAILFVLTAVLTTGMLLYSADSSYTYYDVAMYLILAAFIYFGHRWAMIVAMLVWTFAKGYAVYEALSGGHPRPWNIFMQVVFWAIYMHYFYRALRVEYVRNRMILRSHQAPSGDDGIPQNIAVPIHNSERGSA